MINTSLNPAIIMDLNFLKQFNDISQQEIDKNRELQKRIQKVSSGLLQIDPARIHELPKAIRVKIVTSAIHETLLKGISLQSLKPYLDSDIVNELSLNTNQYKTLIQDYFENNKIIALHESWNNDKIQEMLQNLPLETRTAIMAMDLSRCSSLQDLSFLSQFPNITTLDLTGAVNLKSLKGIEHLPHLTTLILNECLYLQDLTGLIGNKTITKLLASQCGSLVNIQAISTCISLKELDFSMCYGLRDVRPIGELSNLEKLSLRGLPKLTTINMCSRLSNLTEIHLEQSGVIDISPLDHLEKLPKKSVYLTRVNGKPIKGDKV